MKAQFLLVLALVACSPKLSTTGPQKPAWLGAKPFQSGYYTGIGHALKTGETNYIQIAKKSALEDLVSEIQVTISSTSILSQLDVNKEFSERFEQIIKTTAANEIEEFELVDAWQDETNYWVYYRLSKARYREIKEEQKRNAVRLATDYYKKARLARVSGEVVQAMSFYFQAIESLEKYLAEAIVVTIDDEEILLVNEIYAGLQQVLDGVRIDLSPSELQVNRRLAQDAIQVVAHASLKDGDKPVNGLPLRAVFQKGNGVIHPEYTTDESGDARVLLSSINSKELEQLITVAIDTDRLHGKTQSAVVSWVTRSLHVPQARLLLKVQRPVIYLSSEERVFGYSNSGRLVSNKLRNLLTTAGFEFTSDPRNADLSFSVSADTERGTMSGSIYVSYFTGTIRVTSVQDGKEIYSTTLNRIRGYGLDYDRSGLDAYNKALENLEKEAFAQLVDAILQ